MDFILAVIVLFAAILFGLFFTELKDWIFHKKTHRKKITKHSSQATFKPLTSKNLLKQKCMKTLLKKITVSFAVGLLCISSVLLCISAISAQLPKHFPAANFYPDSLHVGTPSKIYNYRSSAQHILPTRAGQKKAPCLKKQTTLGGTGDDVASIVVPTAHSSFVVCGGTTSTDGDFHVHVPIAITHLFIISHSASVL